VITHNGRLRPSPAESLGNRAFETAILDQLSGLARYAGTHVRQYGSPIADDGVLGPAFRSSLANLRAMLNGETGRLDCCTLDHAIITLYQAAGFEGDEP
jgi:hypothetical protein